MVQHEALNLRVVGSSPTSVIAVFSDFVVSSIKIGLLHTSNKYVGTNCLRGFTVANDQLAASC